MLLSIVIVNYKVPLFLEQCLLSVATAVKDMKHEVEVWVVDNDSQDDSIAYLRPRFPDVNFIENTENVGFSRANNQAIHLSKGRYVLLLNPDTFVGDQTLSEVVNFMEQHNNVAGVGVKMVDAHGRFLPESKRGFPSPWVSFCKIVGLNRLFPHSARFNKYHMGHLDKDHPQSIEILSGAFMCMRRSVLDKVGLLDERFFMYGEDIDLSYRLLDGGKNENYYLPCPILHYKGESSSVTDTKYLNSFYGAMGLFFEKYYKNRLGILARVAINLAIRGRTLLAYVLRPFRKVKSQSALQAPVKWSPEEGKEKLFALAPASHILINTDEFGATATLELMQELADRKHTFYFCNNRSEHVVAPSI